MLMQGSTVFVSEFWVPQIITHFFPQFLMTIPINYINEHQIEILNGGNCNLLRL